MKAFTKSSPRFDNKHINEVPGPGFYNVNNEEKSSSLIKISPSFSSKGYGNAFVSKTDKFLENRASNQTVPGPGFYTVDSNFASGSKSPSRIFKSNDSRVPYLMPEETPGPLDYYIPNNPGISKFILKKQSAVFSSKVDRNSFSEHYSEAPGIGIYNVDNVPKQKNLLKWAKNEFKRFPECLPDAGVPGPGTYFAVEEEKTEEEVVPAYSKGGRSCGGFSGRYLGKQNSQRRTSHQAFGMSQTNRFSQEQLDRAADMPGPPTLSPILPSVPDPPAGPGEYSVANFTIAACVKDPQLKSSNFRSTSCLHQPIVKPLFERAPGPAYYNPKDIRAATVPPTNYDGRWV